MRSFLVVALAVVFISAASAQVSTPASPPPPSNSTNVTVALDKVQLLCKVAQRSLVGNPIWANTTTSERICFYTCDVKNAQWYQWYEDAKSCECYTTKGIAGVVPVTPTVLPQFSYYVYGNIRQCFPFCSVAVDRCSRCAIKNGGLTCVFNYSKRRCCCTPPTTPTVKGGKLGGCSKTGRTLLEHVNRRQALEAKASGQVLEEDDLSNPMVEAVPQSTSEGV